MLYIIVTDFNWIFVSCSFDASHAFVRWMSPEEGNKGSQKTYINFRRMSTTNILKVNPSSEAIYKPKY